ncbi:MAG: Uma2 family endonuclease [Planctomycetaceae bacterium]|nr:MAG: Uma2 family endonuclease [Planctomycetaceae bacterium]
MSTVTVPVVDPFQPPPGPVWRFSVADYHRLIASRVLGEDDRVELLEGWIVPKMTHNPPHDGTIQIVSEHLRPLLSPGWVIRIQSAITTSDSEPEPDIAIVRGNARTYLKRHPGPADIALVVEVAESTLDQDRVQKARLYARASIPVYWVINLVDNQVEVFSNPTGAGDVPGYRTSQVAHASDVVPFVLDGQRVTEIRVAELLPGS